MYATVVRRIVIGMLAALLFVLASKFQVLAGPRGQAQAQQQQPAQQQPPAQAPQQQQKPPEYTIPVNVPAINVDVVVTDDHGDVLGGFKKENFRVLDNGAPQNVTNFAPSDAPITVVMLVEFSARGYGWYAGLVRYWGVDFPNHLKKNDWLALVTFSMTPRILVDFTQNKQEVQEAVSRLYIPDWREANLFDAVLDTVDRLKDVQGKKAIMVLASGYDTFSKHTLDDVMKRLKQTDVTIFCVGVAQPLQDWIDSHTDPRGSGLRSINYLQAQNQMATFARMTGGNAWFPRFDGEIPSIFELVGSYLRNQYSLAYTPNTPMDGKYHKIKVDLVDPNGQPLVVTNEKGKKLKCKVYAREGYEAPKGAAPVGD